MNYTAMTKTIIKHFGALIIALVVAALTLVWFLFDYHFPTQDESGHIMNSIAFRDLLVHFRPWSYHWWYQCLTVNCFYPPFAYLINGFFLLIFGQSRFAEQSAMAFFAGLMVMAVYGTTRLLSGSRLAACLAAIFLALYPSISSLSHSFFLDLPEVAMTALSLMTLLWWRSASDPSWKRTILTAVVLACACLTKQLVAAYILPLGLYFLLIDLGLGWPMRKLRTNWLTHLVAIGLITALIGLPFLIINHDCTRSLTNSIVQVTTLKYGHRSYLDKLNLYYHLLPIQMSPFLFTIFLLSLFLIPARKSLLVPITISAVGGFLLTCAWPGLVLDIRYTVPFLIAAAVYSGLFLDSLLASHNKWARILAAIILFIATLNYMYFNFVPYPIPLSTLPWQSSISDHNGNPDPPSDWGHSLVIKTIEQVDANKPVFLNVLTNSHSLHGPAFELLLKEQGLGNIVPTSSRLWTIVGDKVEFNPDTAVYYQWYLLKTGDNGYSFYDKKSELNFNRLINFVRHSNKYKLMRQKVPPR